ncbi:MAG: hypothetical protein ACRC6M_16120 [Microcystaceae cyanobacterium]
MIRLQLKQTHVSPGQIVRGDCHWQTNSDQDFQPATLKIGWRTEGRGDTEKMEILFQQIRLASFVPVPFECEIPLGAPLSYDGELIRIIWEVVLELRQGSFGEKEQDKVIIRVVSRLAKP